MTTDAANGLKHWAECVEALEVLLEYLTLGDFLFEERHYRELLVEMPDGIVVTSPGPALALAIRMLLAEIGEVKG